MKALFYLLSLLAFIWCVESIQAQVAPEFAHAPRVGPHIVSLGSKADGACLEALRTLERELKVLEFPNDWTVGVTCNSVTWEAARHRAGDPPTLTAFTGLKPKLTVINAAVFQQLEPVYRRTLAHELGHIRCNCASEGRAEDEGDKILKMLGSKPIRSGAAREDEQATFLAK